MYNKEYPANSDEDLSNPLSLKTNLTSLTTLTDYSYSQILVKPKFDKDAATILNRVQNLQQLLPQKLDIPYSFVTAKVNGERIFNTEKSLICIKEYGSDFIREYYPAKQDNNMISKIIERDKTTGKIISKLERTIKDDGYIKTNIIVFDEKINNKYIMFQIEDDFSISSITEIFDNGKQFRTLFRNPKTLEPERYAESAELKNKGFIIINCQLKSANEISNIKINTAEKDIFIEYKNNQKIIDVRRKVEF